LNERLVAGEIGVVRVSKRHAPEIDAVQLAVASDARLVIFRKAEVQETDVETGFDEWFVEIVERDGRDSGSDLIGVDENDPRTIADC
jgi:hypothetical protein